jgi:DNA end-binding protein Ku
VQRSVWRGAISFGLIFVPVQLFAASRDGTLKLHLLDSRDFAPVGYQRINKTSGKTVDWQHIVKGYEYKKGQYVALSEADFKHANVKATETIQIETFTNAADIPPILFETPYYLAPAKGGQKVYALLTEALESTGKVAIATFVMRGRQHLCMVGAMNERLMLMTLRFDDEVLSPATEVVRKKTAGFGAAELTMAKQLVEKMSGPWNPAMFKDTYRRDLMRRIQEKIRKKQTHSLAPDTSVDERPKAQVIDLMEALQKSLATRAPARRAAAARKAQRG